MLRFSRTLCRDEGDLEVEVEMEIEPYSRGEPGDWPGQRGSPPEGCTIIGSVKHNGEEIEVSDAEINYLVNEAMKEID